MKQALLSCIKCGKSPEDILVINCGHNLCLECAANRIYNYSKTNKSNFQTIVCEQCSTPTILDPPTANTVMLKIPKTPKTQAQSLTQIYPSQEKEPRKDEIYFCKSHPNEEVRCFCFDDFSEPICAECVVSGVHKNHNVQSISVASSTIKEKLNIAIESMNDKTNKMTESLISLKHKRENLENASNSRKNEFINYFEGLKEKINQKEKEINILINKDLDLAINEINSLEEQIATRLQVINNNIEIIQSENQENNISKYVDFYSNNFDSLRKLSEMGKMDVIPSTDYFEKFNLTLNKDLNQSLKAQILPIADCINNIDIQGAKEDKFPAKGIVKNPSLSNIKENKQG